jgi:ABC-type sugar transport system ATPase subunit
MSETAIRFEHVGKLFPGVKALNDVTFEIASGQVHCIVGENGAGKSTLIKILAGVNSVDEGHTYLFEKRVRFRSPEEAKKAGIGVVYQELSNFVHLDVASNLFCNNLPTKRGAINYKHLHQKAREALDICGLSYISERSIMKDISLGSQQMVEIARLINENARVVILDEPTSALTEIEVKKLYELIERMKNQGITIIYISHRLDEVLELADSITVLKDGEHVITFRRDNSTTKNMLVRYMVGRDVEFDYRTGETAPGNVVLEVASLSSGKQLQDISFQLRRGEILGVAGLEGSGRTEILETLFGWRERTNGRIFIEGKPKDIKNPVVAKRHGMAYITKERKLQGLFLRLDVKTNIAAASPKRYEEKGIIRYKRISENARHYVDAMRIKCTDLKQKTMNLSGGNQQKVLLSMWLANDPEILLIDEPTRGVDVGAKAEIHALLRGIVSKGKSVIIVSSELPEILASCDRVMVMYEGRLMDILDNDANLTEERIMQLASGIH